MQINNAEWSGGKLILTTTDADAIRFAYNFKAGEYTITPAKKPRSLDANAYFFALADKIAAATGITKTEIYRNAIREIGGNSDIVCVKENAVDALCAGWEHNGLGWQTERIPSKIKGCVNVILYYGSSTYDSKQMSRLIDNIVQDAKALGIETLPPEKIDALMEEWHGQ